MTTVGQWIAAFGLSPDGYDTRNDGQEIEATYRNARGDEMIVFGLGEGRIIHPINGTSVYESGPISDYLALPNNRDWIEGEAAGYRIEVSSTEWAGTLTNGRWVPAVAGIYNHGTDMSDEDASTFPTRAEAEEFQRRHLDPEADGAEFRIVEV